MMNGVDNVLTKGEFSLLREAKFKTMAMMYEVFNQDDRFGYSCNNCKVVMENIYHCPDCEAFDLCSECYYKEKDHHPHEMKKCGFFMDVVSSPADPKQANIEEERLLLKQKCIQFLVHACECRDYKCNLPFCQLLKRIVCHSKICKRKSYEDCPICRKLFTLSGLHAKYCQVPKCRVAYCRDIREKQRQLKARWEQARMKKHPMVEDQ